MAPPAVEEYVRQAKVEVDPEPYAIVRLESETTVEPSLAARALYWFRAAGDHTLVLPLRELRGQRPISGQVERDDGWRRITLGVEVPLDQPGFIRPFADALARERISILPIAGYRFDHFLVHEVNLARAVAAIERVRSDVAGAQPARP